MSLVEDDESVDFLRLIVERPLAFDQLVLPPQQRFRSEDRDELFQVFGMGDGPLPYILPVLAISFALIPGLTVLIRSTVIEVRRQAFVSTAFSKGLSHERVYLHHILRVAAIPVITYVGMQAVHLVGTLVTIEVLFSLPGLGGLAVQAALDRDPMLLQGAVLTIAALTLIILLIVDMAVMLLDPRIVRTPE